MKIIFKVLFFSLVCYLILEQFSLNSNKKLKRALGENISIDLKKKIGLVGSRFAKYFNRKEVENRIRRAGNPWGLTVDGFVGMKVILPLLMILIQIYLRSNIYYLVIVSSLIFFLPDLFVNLVTNDRKRIIKKELPDIVDIFESAIASGIDVGTAFNLAAEYVKGKQLKKELSLMSAKYAVTKDKEEALVGFRDNINMYDTDLLALALLQDSRTGKAQDMLESLAREQANNVLATIEVNAKLVEYRVLIACSLMAVSIALTIFYPYISLLNDGLYDIFK